MKNWRFIKQIDISVLIQLVFLASLIVGTWVNLQNQLLLLRSDINRLLESQKQFQQQVEHLNTASVGYEYRLRAIEKRLPDADIGNGSGM
ncbi:MAG: hypothetical protein WC770_01970 [Phycisphaerae bacterium]|jgi:hypothetical protein